MPEATKQDVDISDGAEAPAEGVRIYEVGYHILSTVKEEDVESVVSSIRKEIEKSGGSLISEGAPQSVKLSYTMTINKGGKNIHYERAYFGWIKFEADSNATEKLNESLIADENVLRFLIFKTLREDTRASARPKTLREVRRTDTITSTPKKGAELKEESGEVSEKELDKALEDLTID
jgi:ribosomal protein S6